MKSIACRTVNSRRLQRIALLLAGLCLGWDRFAEAADDPPLSFSRGVVAADHLLASEAGAEMLRRGGNVVDAAVATAFTLSVVRPESCGLGGGGFMVIWNANSGEAVALDYRERAPAAATSDMFTNGKPRRAGDVNPPITQSEDSAPAPAHGDDRSSREGGLAIAVPGEVAGLCFALEKYGTLDLKTVLDPAIRLARDGHLIDAFSAGTIREMQRRLQKEPAAASRFAALRELHLNRNGPVTTGTLIRSPLLDVLQRIAAQGADGFYRGPVAAAIVAAVKEQGGIITLEDLASMEPVVRRPLRGEFDGYDIITMPPPSSGGVALLEILNIVGAYEQSHPDQRLERLGHNSTAYVHLITEASKHAFADRAAYLGDADFADVPVGRLISPNYAARLASRIDRQATQPIESYGRHLPKDDAGTSHFCVMDAAGNAVACTETINTTFGSLVVEPRYGIVLNNQMDDFSAVPGEPNAFGLIQSEANAIAPGKKPLSSMTPTILVQEGKAVFAAGASGGPRIISATLQTLLNMTRFDHSPQRAAAEPRFHHQWLPDELRLERRLSPLAMPLEALGHQVILSGELAAAQAAARSKGLVLGGSDPRKGGRPAGH